MVIKLRRRNACKQYGGQTEKCSINAHILCVFRDVAWICVIYFLMTSKNTSCGIITVTNGVFDLKHGVVRVLWIWTKPYPFKDKQVQSCTVSCLHQTQPKLISPSSNMLCWNMVTNPLPINRCRRHVIPPICRVSWLTLTVINFEVLLLSWPSI